MLKLTNSKVLQHPQALFLTTMTKYDSAKAYSFFGLFAVAFTATFIIVAIPTIAVATLWPPNGFGLKELPDWCFIFSFPISVIIGILFADDSALAPLGAKFYAKFFT
ncbi:MAG: hypothetical protein GY793_03070 [Proteobacteria bacterium]|nr:hypothetical protein [Pseudomonadota bacterium]